MIQIQKLGNGNTINGSTKMPPQRWWQNLGFAKRNTQKRPLIDTGRV